MRAIGTRRVAVAFVLVAAAVGLPSIAWYFAGSSSKEREAERLVARAEASATGAASQVAASLAARLDALIAAESSRPFYHYQNLYHDPKGAYEGPSVIPSPLSGGPLDPMVQAHFQFDPDGRVTVPTINPDVPELNRGNHVRAQRAVLELLERCDTSCRVEPGRAVAAAKALRPARGGAIVRVEVMDEAAWLQNLNASELYVDLKGWDGSGPCAVRQRTEEASRTFEKVEILVGRFEWRTIPLGEDALLGAVREVATPVGTYSQGFVLAHDVLERWLARDGVEAAFTPVERRGGGDGAPGGVAITSTGWEVAVSASDAVAEARARGRASIASFRRTFGFGFLGACLAGFAVVGLVWQSERMAGERSRFAASAAHELRTPLAGMQMYGEMLSEGLGDPARSREYARRIANEAERLGRVVGNVLGFARLERGGLRIRAEAGDLAGAVARAVERLRPSLETAGVHLDVTLDGDLPEIRFDPDAVDQIVHNLLDNGEKYTRASEDRTVHVSLRRDGSHAVLAVADHGPGVPRAERSRLFRPFTRGGADDAPPGLGLGLVLSRILARRQGADLEYRDAPWGGARFEVRFSVA